MMTSAPWLRDRSGNVTVLFAGGLTLLMAISGLAVDAGTFFLQKRKLQGIADAAALAGAANVNAARSAIGDAVHANGGDDVSVVSVVAGSYVADTARTAAARFTSGAVNPNAVRVTLNRDVPTFFGQFLTGRPRITVAAQSTAARVDLAAFSLGSRLAAVQGGLPNAVLSGLAGTELSLSVLDYQALVTGQVDILQFAEALRSTAQLQVASFGDILASSVTLPQAVNALAAATSDAAAAATLRRIATRLPADRIVPADLIDLGPLSANARADPDHPIQVDGYAIVQAMLQVGGRRHYVESDVDLALPGVASSRLMLVMGDHVRRSPWLSVGTGGGVTVRTAQTRLYLDTTVSGAGIAALRLPILIELAQAQAELRAVSCASARSGVSVSLTVTPSVGEVAIADIDAAAFADLGTAIRLRPATILKTPIATVTVAADIALGGTTSQLVDFSGSDIADGRIKTVSTNDIAQGVVASLVERVSINVSGIGGLGVPLIGAPLATTIGNALRPAAAPLDQIVDQVTALVDVRIGQADVRVNGVHCGSPVLVG